MYIYGICNSLNIYKLITNKTCDLFKPHSVIKLIN